MVIGLHGIRTRSESKFEVERAGSFSQVLKDHTTSTEDGYYLLYRSPGIEGNRTSLELREPGRYIASCQPSIEAISGSNADGFLAIDDVLIDTTGCEDTSKQPSREFQCGDGKTVPRDRVCDYVPDCDNRADESSCGDCDFSEGACGWNLDDARNRGTTVWQVVPIGLVSRSPPNGADQRRDGAHLDVDLYMNAAGYTMQVWTRTALGKPSLEGFWNRVSVDIGRHKGEVSFDFATNQYPQGKAVFAVDSIHYSGCTLPTKAGNCTDKFRFHCTNDVCIDSYERCNYVDDCGDNSDEENCEPSTSAETEDGQKRRVKLVDKLWRQASGAGIRRQKWDVFPEQSGAVFSPWPWRRTWRDLANERTLHPSPVEAARLSGALSGGGGAVMPASPRQTSVPLKKAIWVKASPQSA
ncbi:hypothetical protein HPB51_002919 [Rhipicephalus microplus]|uniref:Uncharacterized protein n=1 Tax=Rhipicephalus microplus TaxID=6941 RepID=A0A9J6DS48_RHIMP|nr:hypothetical protein HPB51_002919 [Rhipicephalus microplus]